MSAARINTALTRACLVAVAVAFLLSGAASGASAARADKKAPTAPRDVRVSAATTSGVSLAWNASRDNVGVQGYSVRLDGNVMARPSQPVATISGLACGRAYTLGITAFDAAGNHSPESWATVATAACADQLAPTAPTGFRQQAATQNDVVLAWDSSTDNFGVVGYGVYRNGVLEGSTVAPTVTLSGFVCGSVYEVSVDAVDAAGNRSQPSATWVETAACTDTQPPNKPILSLGSATETSLVLSWQPGADNVGVDHYNVFLNGAKVAQTTGLTWTYTGLACNTDYALGLEVEDAAGNTSLLSEATLAPARTEACSPAPPPRDATAPSQPASLTVAAATDTSITLAWTASTDNVGVAGYGVYVGNASVQTKAQPGATVSGLQCGTAYTLAVDAYDSAGNRSTKASLVATTAPCADIQAPSAPANVAVISRTATSIALSWSASSDNVGVVGYGLYQGAALTGTTAVATGIFSNLPCGSAFTLAVDSYDAAGNRSGRATLSASTTACPDTTPPSTPTGVSTSNVTGTSLTLGWNASTDNVGVTGYDVYRNGAKIGSSTGTSSSQTGLACGTSYAFAVVSYDAAGNRSPQAQLTTATAACSAPPGATRPAVQPGQSWDAACEAASPGNVIPVAPGNHPSQPISCFKAAPGVTFVPAGPGTINVGSAGAVSGCLSIVGSYLTFRFNKQLVTPYVTQSGKTHQCQFSIGRGGAHHIVVDGFDSGPVFIAANDIVVRNSDLGPGVSGIPTGLACCTTFRFLGNVNEGPDRVILEDNKIHSGDRIGSSHPQCSATWYGHDFIIRRNHFVDCLVFHLWFPAGPDGAPLTGPGEIYENTFEQRNTAPSPSGFSCTSSQIKFGDHGGVLVGIRFHHNRIITPCIGVHAALGTAGGSGDVEITDNLLGRSLSINGQSCMGGERRPVRQGGATFICGGNALAGSPPPPPPPPPGNSAPTACFTRTPASSRVGESVTFNASCSSDPDGDSLTYTWDIAPGGDGIYERSGVQTSYAYRGAGTKTARLRVDDGRGHVVTLPQTFTVNP